MTNESVIRRFVEHPKKRTFVITLTSVILLALGLPAVDEYSAINGRRKELERNLTTALETSSKLHDYEALLSRQQVSNQSISERVMTADRVEHLRTEVVQLVRDAGCGMRRIRLSEPRERAWSKDDNVLNARPVADKSKATPFVLRTRQFTVSVTGPVHNVHQLLAELSRKNYLIHATGFTMQKSDESDESVELELELLLIELTKAAPQPSSA